MNRHIRKLSDIVLRGSAMNRIEITENEINERLMLNRKRLCEPFYDAEHIFASPNAGWPGDKEGRALLAFVCLENAGMEKVPCMEALIKELPDKLNEKGFLGEIKECFFEQQLSGHSWLLRGLCEYYEKYPSEGIMKIINGIVENLYLPLCGKIKDYPVSRAGENNGGVDGHTTGEYNGWRLSTDTCCAFMSIDGLSHAYGLTGNARILSLLEEMTDAFMKIDKRSIKAQTHCTLTAARGMLRLYGITGAEKYLDHAKSIFSLYTDFGMTYTYENYNWWGRPDTWTEPCAIVDSLMLALGLFRATGEAEYRTLAARIYHNGFATLQRCSGGAGTQKIVCETRPLLEISGWEAPQCCTMRLAEGLKFIKENRELLYAELAGEPKKDEKGRLLDGDILYAVTENSEDSRPHPLLRYYKLTEAEIRATKQRIIFD